MANGTDACSLRFVVGCYLDPQITMQLRKQDYSIDRPLLLCVLLAVFIGMLAVANSSAPQALALFDDRLYFIKQQLVWGAIGLVLMTAVSFVDYKIWEKMARPIFVLSILLLIGVLVPGVGIKALGARRWISLGFTSFQPSELVKLTLAIYLARILAKKVRFLHILVPFLVIVFLIMLQPDFGTTLVVSFMAFVQFIVSGTSLVIMGGFGVVGVALSFLVVILSPYRKERLLTFLNGTTDPLGSNYHVRQILLALGSGGFLGVGLGQSRQKYLFLPETATDSVFAVIAEEVGFVGAFLLISLLAFIVFRSLWICRNLPDDFGRILGYGLVAWLGGQIVLNIGAMVALFPLTGIPLPFISYGGTSLVANLVGVGILLNMSKYANYKQK